jgi:hypothetical protein
VYAVALTLMPSVRAWECAVGACATQSPPKSVAQKATKRKLNFIWKLLLVSHDPQPVPVFEIPADFANLLPELTADTTDNQTTQRKTGGGIALMHIWRSVKGL